MLDTARWRERLRGIRPRSLSARVPADCPRCGARARGGRPCPACLPAPIPTGDGRRCPVCARRLADAACGDCARRPPAFDRVVAAFDYEAAGRDLILLYKARRRFELSGALADLLALAAGAADPPLPGSTILVPVPSRREAILRRGFNPAAELARALSARLGLRCEPGMLRRTDGGAKQALLGRAARRVAQRDAYYCGPVPGGCHVAVVDDVLTTGSTLDGIARALKASGATVVTGLVLARAVPDAARSPARNN
ncbi:ComF family protein [Castellaniella sp. GW247-6E4]|uniref:ComF family protein n=1 Tax=Castellaniella sp. GW247-6E4 TaxID=3140380 RepID=UPI0033154F5F